MSKNPGIHILVHSSPNTMWINVVHKYNRGSIMTTELSNKIKDTRQAAYFIMRGSAIIGKLLRNIQTITEKKRYHKNDQKFT